ncbi:MAG: signal recognition particle-docking protein FtsY [Xanthomonadales bacterium]|nr:signal recognition particle-docking protein FtsY [Xanthomonadales bacterium]
MFRFFKRKPETAPAADPEAAPQTPAAPASVPASSWRDRLRGSLLGRQVSALFSSHPKLDEDLLDQLETTLLTADVGVKATTEVLDDLRRRMQAREFADVDALFAHLRRQLVAMLRPIEKPLELPQSERPFVLLVVGVNGAGKTTTIGKLAKWMKREGLDVMLAAGDTFRAAAVEQLRTWGERNQVPVVAQGGSADSASVIYDALAAATARHADVLIADTAGRLHTQAGLMDELAKVKRVLGKLDATAPHETLLVIDGNTGQNALSQARQFHQAVGLSGLVVTKLDGTAKGGVVFALAREVGVPIRFIGVGEGILDLRVFDAEEFVDGLLPERAGHA